MPAAVTTDNSAEGVPSAAPAMLRCRLVKRFEPAAPSPENLAASPRGGGGDRFCVCVRPLAMRSRTAQAAPPEWSWQAVERTRRPCVHANHAPRTGAVRQPRQAASPLMLSMSDPDLSAVPPQRQHPTAALLMGLTRRAGAARRR